MMLLIPIPALVFYQAAPPQSVNYGELKPNAWQKALIEAIQKDGFTIISSRREKSIWFSIRLEVKKNGQPDSYPLTVVLDPGMRGDTDGDGEVPPSVNAITIVDLSKRTDDEAKALAAALGVTYKQVSIKVGKYPNGKPNLNLRFTSGEVVQPAMIVKGLNEVLSVAQASLTAKIAPKEPPAPEPTDPVGKTLKTSKLIYTDIGGFYKLQYDYSDTKRKQIVNIRQEIWDYNSLKVQEAFSIFWESETAPSADLLQKIFLKSFTIGGLVLEVPSEKQKLWRVRYRIDVPTDCTPERLKTYLSLVSGTGDALEKELASEDKL
jgi:hypothetical protein